MEFLIEDVNKIQRTHVGWVSNMIEAVPVTPTVRKERMKWVEEDLTTDRHRSF